MGHVPVSGPDGSALWLSALLAAAKFYVHLNNTSTLFDPASQERGCIRLLELHVADNRWTVTL